MLVLAQASTVVPTVEGPEKVTLLEWKPEGYAKPKYILVVEISASY